MEKWRLISLAGIILGIAVSVIDFLIESVPYVITIPIESTAIILIFAGLIIRKRKNKTDSCKWNNSLER